MNPLLKVDLIKKYPFAFLTIGYHKKKLKIKFTLMKI